MEIRLGAKYNGVCDVQRNFTTYFNLLTNKVASMFIWQNLPETIDQRYLELSLLLGGKVCWFKDNDKLYCLSGNIGGPPNVYYEPTEFIIANPVLGSKQLKVRNLDGSSSVENLDGILMANSDVDYESTAVKGGLYSLIYQTAGLLADNISSLNISQLNSRISILYTADSEAQARAGELILREVYNGKPYKILEQDVVEKINVNPVASAGQNNSMMSLIEAHQYILAQFFQEIGISANYNMKRERLNTAEVEMNNGALDVNIFSMLKNRQEAVALINEKFGTNISVDLNFAIFNEANGNADAQEESGDENQDNEVADGEEPTNEETAAGAGLAEADDDDLQVEGVSEDNVEEAIEDQQEEKPVTMEEEIEKEIKKEGDDE